MTTKTKREELIEAGICVACQGQPMVHGGLHCRHCLQRLTQADQKALKGLFAEINYVLFRTERKPERRIA